MFLRKKKTVTFPETRILDYPMPMMIAPTYLAASAKNGQLIVLHGYFQGISDSDAYNKLKDKLDKYDL